MADNLTPKEEFLLNPVTEHNITDAAIASFETNLKHPVKVTVPITPQQDLHGYDAPWPAGGGKNIADIRTATIVDSQFINVTGTEKNLTFRSTANYGRAGFVVDTEIGQQYTISAKIKKTVASGAHSSFYLTDSVSWNWQTAYGYFNIGSDVTDEILYQKTITATSNTLFIGVYCSAGNFSPDELVVKELQVVKGSTVLAWTPYSNECPISGWAGANVFGTGKNLFDEDGADWKLSCYINASGNEAENSNYKYTQAYTKVQPGHVYTLQINKGTNKSVGCTLAYYDANKVFIDRLSIFSSTSDTGRMGNTFTMPANAVFIRLNVPRNDTTEIQLEESTTATAYELFGTTLPINWQSSAGTIYGGTVTLNEDGSADIVVTHEGYDFSNLNIVKDTTSFFHITLSAMQSIGYVDDIGASHGVMCSIYKTGKGSGYSNIRDTGIDYMIYGRAATKELYIRDSRYNDAAALKAALSGQTILIRRATARGPIHFPNVGQLKAFLGQNNIWSDIGNVDVKYLTQNSATGLEYRGDRALELRRRAMIGDAPTIHTTVGSEETGGLASFKSYIKAPVKKIEIPFGPKQDLHGQEYPYPAGGGKNKIDVFVWATGSLNAYTGEVAENSNRTVSPFIYLDAGTYTISRASTSANYWKAAKYDSNKVFVAAIFDDEKKQNTFTLSEACYIRVGLDRIVTESDKIQLELGSTVTPYAPYSNECPIEGWDGANVQHNGVNIFDGRHESGTISPETGADDSTSNEYRRSIGYFKVKGGASYYFVSPESYKRIFWYDSSYNFISSEVNLNAIKTAPTNARFARIFWKASAVSDPSTMISINYPSTDTTPHAYTATTLPITFNQSGDHEFFPIQEGTGDPSPENVRPIYPGLTFTRDDDSVLSVYGGTLTVNSDGTGEIKNNILSETLDGTNKTLTSGPEIINGLVCCYNYFVDLGITPYKIGVGIHSYKKSDRFLIDEIDNKTQLIQQILQIPINSPYVRCFLDVTVPENPTASDIRSAVKQFFTDNPTQIVYEIETPITYTLSVTETNRALEALGLTQHIGQIYGGTVTINPDGSADVVSSYGYKVYNGTQTPSYFPWGTYGDNNEFISVLYPPLPLEDDHAPYGNHDALTGCICNQCTSKTPAGSKIGPNLWSFYAARRSFGPYFMLPTSLVGETIEMLNAYLAEHPISISYPLNTPRTYHFSNLEQLKVWLGENNFWCDISDDITVKYWNRG